MTPMNPAVSVIVPLYNKRRYVARAVQSALQQTVRELELIVVDDGSTDGSIEELARFRGDQRLRIVRQDNAGVSAARNRGVREARAELCAFLDADDIFLPQHLEGLAELARRYPSAGLLGTAYYNAFPDGRHISRTMGGERYSLLDDYFAVSRQRGFLPVFASSIAIRRDMLDRTGGFPEGIAIGEDLEFFARVALDFPVAYDASPSAVYFQWTPLSAMSTYRWRPDIPPVVETISRKCADGTGNASAIDYAAWVLLKHAACGIVAADRQGARALLRHPILNQTALRNRRRILWAASCAPDAVLRSYLKLRNWQQDRSKSTGIADVPDALNSAGVA